MQLCPSTDVFRVSVTVCKQLAGLMPMRHKSSVTTDLLPIEPSSRHLQATAPELHFMRAAFNSVFMLGHIALLVDASLVLFAVCSVARPLQ